jgi:hypothetical protein
MILWGGSGGGSFWNETFSYNPSHCEVASI